MDPACISIPPVIITKVTNREMIQMEIISLMLPNNTRGIRNLLLAVANMINSRTRIQSRTVSQLFNAFFMTEPLLFYPHPPLSLLTVYDAGSSGWPCSALRC